MQSGAIRPIPSMLPRALFNEEHNAFRETVRKFYEKEVVPNIEKYEAQQHVDRDLWNKAGALGLLCTTMPEEYGGSAVDRLYSMILIEEQAYAMDSSTGFSLHSDIVANYINNFGNEAQKQLWLPRMASGEVVTAIAMTEPGTGSDLQAVRTSAVLDGDEYVINGSKIFITNGYLCDMAIVVCKTGHNEKGSANLSLIMVEANRAGFSKGKPLNKIGMKGQDTCELFFDNVRVPKENLSGMEGMGFIMLMKELAWERMRWRLSAKPVQRLHLPTRFNIPKTVKPLVKPLQAFKIHASNWPNCAQKLILDVPISIVACNYSLTINLALMQQRQPNTKFQICSPKWSMIAYNCMAATAT